jgi:hypothetical protein
MKLMGPLLERKDCILVGGEGIKLHGWISENWGESNLMCGETIIAHATYFPPERGRFTFEVKRPFLSYGVQ